MGTFEERMNDSLARHKAVEAIKGRFENLSTDRATFCRKHKIDQGQLTRWLNGTNLPERPSIKRVEKALTKEGV